MTCLESSLFTFFFTHLSQLALISFVPLEVTYPPFPCLVFFLNSQIFLLAQYLPLYRFLQLRLPTSPPRSSVATIVCVSPPFTFASVSHAIATFSLNLKLKVGDYHGGQPWRQFFKNSNLSRAAPPVTNATFPLPLSRVAKIRVSFSGLKLSQVHGREFFALRPWTAAHCFFQR